MSNTTELQEMGREVASAMLKGAMAGVKPTRRVPLITLMHVTGEHGIQEMDPKEMGTLAQAMEEALEEAALWESQRDDETLASKGG